MSGPGIKEGWFETNIRNMPSRAGEEFKQTVALASSFGRRELKERLPLYRDDYQLYASENILVQDEKAKAVPFIFRRAQLRLWLLEKECIEKGIPFWIEVLKIRQHGCSLYFSNRSLWKTAFTPNSKALILAHDDPSTANIFEMLKFSWRNLPDLMQPTKKNDNRDVLFFANPDTKQSSFEGLDSRIHVATAGNVHAGASYTCQHVHISEFGRFDEVTDTNKLMISLMQSIPFEPTTSIIIESTAHGEGNFKRRWDSDNGFIKEFISYVAVEKYREETDSHFPLSAFDNNEYGNEEEIALLIEKEILKWYPEWTKEKNKSEIEHEVYCRLAWRRKTLKIKCNGDKKAFDQEYPITPERAFMLSGDSVYPNEKMTIIVGGLEHKAKHKIDPPDRYTFDPSATEYKGNNWTIDLALTENPYGPVFIYEKPLYNHSYTIGIDGSEGIAEGDESALVVVRLPDFEEVAAWAGRIDPDTIGDLAYILGRCYNNALIGVENQYGQTILSRLRRDLKYPVNRIYRDKKLDQVRETENVKFGWHSNESSNRARRDYVRGLIRDERFKFNHLPNAIEHQRCKKFITEGKAPKYLFIDEQGNKKSPNFTIATGIALQMARLYPVYVTTKEREVIKGSVKDWVNRIKAASEFTGLPSEHVNTF